MPRLPWSHDLSTVYVPLSLNCSGAMRLRQLGVRRWAFPYDWVILPPKEILRTLDEDFAGWLDPSHLQFHQQLPKRYQEIPEGETEVRPIVLDTQHQSVYMHDFQNATVENLASVTKKYQRRISRLQALLRQEETSEQLPHHVTFILDSSPKKIWPRIEKLARSLNWPSEFLASYPRKKTHWPGDFPTRLVELLDRKYPHLSYSVEKLDSWSKRLVKTKR